jgi:tryptophan synthase beta chain
LVEAKAIAQTAAFEAAVRFARCEGIIPAPEPAHAIRAVFDEAEAAKDAGDERVILFNLSGHGHFDMSAYTAYFAGELEDLEMPEEELASALERLPEAPALA